jgi:HlyD family secretion protein
VGLGEVVQNVTATGDLQPVLNVNVSSQISGIISKLYVDWNSSVKEHQILAELDPSTYEASLAQAQGQLANAKANYSLTKINSDRTRKLFEAKLVSQSDLDTAEAQLLQAEAQVKIQEAAVQTVQVNVSRCKIYSPIDGMVISRQVDLGNTVAASLSAPTLFIIANDLTKMQINANVSEADIGNIEMGQTVNFTVDAFPGRQFHGRVSQIRNSPLTQQNVVVYATIIEVNNADLKLKPGMTANVAIVVARREKTLRVANGALRVRVPEGLAVIPAVVPTEKVATADAAAPAGKPLTEQERREKFRELRRDAGITGGGPPSPEAMARLQQLAKERGIELPANFGAPRGERGERGDRPATQTNGPITRTVYKLIATDPKDPKLQAVTVKLGITDGVYTEVMDGLKEGDVLVTSIYSPTAKVATPANSNPFGGGQRRF